MPLHPVGDDGGVSIQARCYFPHPFILSARHPCGQSLTPQVLPCQAQCLTVRHCTWNDGNTTVAAIVQAHFQVWCRDRELQYHGAATAHCPRCLVNFTNKIELN